MMKNSAGDAIVAEDLAKRFGDIIAVDSVTFNVHRGELFGFLGPNGAGKTTTINILIGLVRPDVGAIRIADIDCINNPKGAQHLIGVVPDESNLYPELTGFENLCFCGSLYGVTRHDREIRARELLDRFDLADAAGRKFAGYSRGMKRRLTIASAIIHKPNILFLDEPTTGIDVAGARQIRQMISDLNRAGTTIFLTTHYIEEAERLCSRIAFIVAGRIVKTGTVKSLMRQTQGRYVVHFAVSAKAAVLSKVIMSEFAGLNCHLVSNKDICVESTEPVRVGTLVRLIEDQGAEVFEARKVRPSLEEVFVQITGIEAMSMKLEKEKARAGGGV